MNRRSTNKTDAPVALLPTQTILKMSHSDQGGKKSDVPSWQLQSKPAEPKEEEQSPPEPPSPEALIEQAKKFLEEDEVRNASTDKKIAFLEDKGLKSEEISELLGVTRNPEATTPPSQVRSLDLHSIHILTVRRPLHLFKHLKLLLLSQPQNPHTYPNNATLHQ